ncbi:MAG: polysaccharide deacetylase family protein [Brevefilum fermentans]|jgi:hypothetical protein|uniref:NodB homology domain-containing protein n=1 Tax=Candidatus Brevifilum fermentans TaxID=1986204 RepID=A0A1Y6K2R8_9CHLR|nr:polysaccharide deacetylase family protein [Brevefilum fermentans]SMX53157.1 protein of unknown function [Brevefilum fermentans]
MYKMFFNYSIDCELPPDGVFGGPVSWQAAEESTRGFVELMDNLGLVAGASLFVYPDVAIKQKQLFREMAENGVEIGLHLHTMRYSKMKNPNWLGALSFDEQLEALKMAKSDLEDVIGQPCLGFRACYASANDLTFCAVASAGFKWTSTSANGSYKPEIYACWAGGWPFPYFPSSKNKLVPGEMDIYEMPITHGLTLFFNNDKNRPLDMRAETPLDVSGPFFVKWRILIEENLFEMEKRNQPVRAVIGASHNTNPYGKVGSLERNNVVRVCQLTQEISERKRYAFTPASFDQIYVEAKKLDAF